MAYPLTIDTPFSWTFNCAFAYPEKETVEIINVIKRQCFNMKCFYQKKSDSDYVNIIPFFIAIVTLVFV